MRKKRKPKWVHISGRRWWDGMNTYHTTRVIVDGEWVFSSTRSYGYGNQYQQTGEDWLEANGYLPGRERYSSGMVERFWNYARRNGIKHTTEVTDVRRKKDL
jgi:hypothetical protein